MFASGHKRRLPVFRRSSGFDQSSVHHLRIGRPSRIGLGQARREPESGAGSRNSPGRLECGVSARSPRRAPGKSPARDRACEPIAGGRSSPSPGFSCSSPPVSKSVVDAVAEVVVDRLDCRGDLLRPWAASVHHPVASPSATYTAHASNVHSAPSAIQLWRTSSLETCLRAETHVCKATGAFQRNAPFEGRKPRKFASQMAWPPAINRSGVAMQIRPRPSIENLKRPATEFVHCTCTGWMASEPISMFA